MSYEYSDKLPNEAAERYTTKLKLIGLSLCPYKFPADDWKDDPTEWPTLTYHHLYHYLIKSPRLYSPEAMENFKSLEAWKFFRSGWVQTIEHMSLPCGMVLLKCDVRPSFRTTDTPHKPWVAIKKDGSVIAAHCDCMAGLGETCSHVGSMLYKIEAAIRTGLTKNAPTDLPCQWNQTFTKSISGAPVAEINLYSDDAKAKLTKRPKLLPSAPNNDEQLNFLKEIQNVQPKTVALSLFGNFNSAFIDNSIVNVWKLPPDLRKFYSVENSNLTPEELNKVCMEKKKLFSLTPDETVSIEEATRNQSLCETWYLQRAGRITGSVFMQAAKASLKKPPVSLVLKICEPNITKLTVPALLWGREHESVAVTLFNNIRTDINYVPELISLTDESTHTDFEMLPVGLCVEQQKPWYGASPDGAIQCSCCGTGVLEVKCPYGLKDKSLKDEIVNKNFYIKFNESDGYWLVKSHQYFYQVQLEMYVTGTLYCDFMVWTPMEYIILRIPFDKNFIEEAFKQSDKFWEEVILPELITRKFESSKKQKVSSTKNATADIKLYCVCKTPYDEERTMFGCDKCDNWFHPECLKMKRGPTTKVWYCPDCKKEKKKNN